MAKGQQRSNREKKKPKADKNKPPKGAPAASAWATSEANIKPQGFGGGKK